MMAPYVEDPKMDWNADDALHCRFIRWKIICENILDCKLGILQESAKCQKSDPMVRRCRTCYVYLMGSSNNKSHITDHMVKV